MDTDFSGHDYRSENDKLFGGDDALQRKSARMQASYDSALIMVSALRRVLTAMRISPSHPYFGPNDEAFTPGNPYSLCTADPWYRGMADRTYRRDVQVSEAIDIPDAPSVSVTHYKGKITGFVDQPRDAPIEFSDSNLTYYVTWLDDIFDKQPPLSKGQEKVIGELNATSSNAFWVKTAHVNGVYDDAAVVAYASRSRTYRDLLMFGVRWPRR